MKNVGFRQIWKERKRLGFMICLYRIEIIYEKCSNDGVL